MVHTNQKILDEINALISNTTGVWDVVAPIIIAVLTVGILIGFAKLQKNLR